MPKIKQLRQTCRACPSQWEGILDNGLPIYIRYRWGYLSARVGVGNGDEFDAVKGEELAGEQIGDQYDGLMSAEELVTALQRAGITISYA